MSLELILLGLATTSTVIGVGSVIMELYMFIRDNYVITRNKKIYKEEETEPLINWNNIHQIDYNTNMFSDIYTEGIELCKEFDKLLQDYEFEYVSDDINDAIIDMINTLLNDFETIDCDILDINNNEEV